MTVYQNIAPPSVPVRAQTSRDVPIRRGGDREAEAPVHAVRAFGYHDNAPSSPPRGGSMSLVVVPRRNVTTLCLLESSGLTELNPLPVPPTARAVLGEGGWIAWLDD